HRALGGPRSAHRTQRFRVAAFARRRADGTDRSEALWPLADFRLSAASICRPDGVAGEPERFLFCSAGRRLSRRPAVVDLVRVYCGFDLVGAEIGNPMAKNS